MNVKLRKQQFKKYKIKEVLNIKETKMAKKKNEINIHSSVAEYLTFITATGDYGIEAIYADENVWLSQKMMSLLYDVEINTINYHLKKLFSDNELDENSVIRKFRITALDGKQYDTKHYNLSAIISVGYKVDSQKAIGFRKWATQIIKEFTIKGYSLDDERLKNGGTILTKQYFEELLERIREIRLSERKFYQKITDIYATALDYDAKSEMTKLFFANVQNKMHYAITGNTAAEIVYERSNADKPNMGLTSWKGSPKDKIHIYDVSVAKNYLSEIELQNLSRLVSGYLDLAENLASRNIPMTMKDWSDRLNSLLEIMDYGLLKDNGKISAELAKQKAESEFEKYRVIQDRSYTSDFDKYLIELENKSKRK